MSPPAAETLTAFGLDLDGVPVAILGGRGLCYRVGNALLKPCDDIAESQWVSEISTTLLNLSPTAYRLPIPLPTISDVINFTFDGWSASSFLPGAPAPKRFLDLFVASRALHDDLAVIVKEKPLAVQNRAFNRFDEADRVTWGEKTLDEAQKVDQEMLAQLQPILDQLGRAWRPLPFLPCQVIHMDLLGNALFQDGSPPGIIDLTFYWRPALYAEAVVVADALAWVVKGEERQGLVDSYLEGGESGKDSGGTGDIRVQLLVRALYWRYVTFAIDPDRTWVRANLPQADYAGAAKVVCDLVVGPALAQNAG
ncbi:hypothetical protein B0H67DRAFT_176996 [Lasiosphaeris hirsuta]|uniref:Aminoglycoside phosphotransferase domain-containing protein n=1 Tax=Lasiosphaeris hirsuta TaxID=260670 RepID=A0AA40AQG4_9PEZI|nr:hypothetical protein B0H67DRAFT_176996 [Lasiosphaeris hirsuta]